MRFAFPPYAPDVWITLFRGGAGRRPARQLRRQFADADFPLRERQLDTVLAQGVPQREVDVAGDIPDAVCRVADPEPQQEVDGVVAEFGHMADRRRRGEHACGLLRRLDREPAHLVQIAVVADAERRVEAQQRARIGPVDDLVGDQRLVRDQVFLAVATAYRGVACAERGYRAMGVPDLDHVARLYRPLQQQD